MNQYFKSTRVKNILAALAVAVFGFILLNLTFLFYSLIFRLTDLIFPVNIESVPYWLFYLRHILFLIIIGLISWLVFRSGIRVLLKAIFLTVPAAVVLVTVGIFLNPWPVLLYIVGGLLTIGLLFYFYRSGQPWLYYYSVILVALTLMIFTLLGGEI